ncbi:MAG: DUF4258 domain-containing protein [Victivallaceae bacterium]
MKRPLKGETGHAHFRIRQRRIPEELILMAVKDGQRTILASRNSIQYTLKGVLGVRDLSLVVITSAEGDIITAYARKAGRIVQ